MIVLFGGIGPLVLTRVTRYDDGSLKSGYVENGGWNFEMRDGEFLAKSGNTIRTRYAIAKCDPVREVPVPKAMDGWHYNRLIEWAEKQ